jgi:uncharacterized protein YlxW (UPF0749 family)
LAKGILNGKRQSDEHNHQEKFHFHTYSFLPYQFMVGLPPSKLMLFLTGLEICQKLQKSGQEALGQRKQLLSSEATRALQAELIHLQKQLETLQKEYEFITVRNKALNELGIPVWRIKYPLDPTRSDGEEHREITLTS